MEGDKAQKEQKRFKCDRCVKSYTRKHDLDRHVRENHQSLEEYIREQKKKKDEPVNKNKCSECSSSFVRKFDLKRHKLLKHGSEEVRDGEQPGSSGKGGTGSGTAARVRVDNSTQTPTSWSSRITGKESS